MVGVLIFCVLLGATIESIEEGADWTRIVGEKAYLTVRLNSSPQPRGKTISAKGEVLAVDRQRCRGAITIYFRADSTAATLRYGDRLLMHGYPEPDRRSIYITSDHYLTTAHDSTSLRAHCEEFRMRMLHRMQGGPLPARYAGIAEALTLGWRADIDKETQSSFRDAGVAHLLAVSGLHVGLLAQIVGIFFFWAGRERKGRILRGSAQLLTVWLFALLTGMAPSTMRAALMFSFFIVSDITGRRTPRLNLLAAAAIVTLVPSPTLLFDIGWQLSYSAVVGILVARPVIMAYRSCLWRYAMVSLAATTATLPVTITTFHRFQPWFLIANILVVPVAGALLFLSLLYMMWPGGITAWPLELLLRIIEWVVTWVSSLPGAVVTI